MLQLSSSSPPRLYGFKDFYKLLELTAGWGIRRSRLLSWGCSGCNRRQEVPQSPFVRRGSSIVLTSFPLSRTPGIFSERDVPITHCWPQHNGLHHMGRQSSNPQSSSPCTQWGTIPGKDAAGEWKGWVSSELTAGLLPALQAEKSKSWWSGLQHNYKPFSSSPKFGMKTDFPHP